MKHIPHKIKKIVLNKFDGRCAYCGTKPLRLCIDHIIPRNHFYSYVKSRHKIPEFLNHLTEWDCNHIDNLFPACFSCNNYKSAMSLETFRRNVGELIQRLNDHFNQYKIAKRFNLLEETNKKVIFHFENQLHQTTTIQLPDSNT